MALANSSGTLYQKGNFSFTFLLPIKKCLINLPSHNFTFSRLSDHSFNHLFKINEHCKITPFQDLSKFSGNFLCYFIISSYFCKEFFVFSKMNFYTLPACRNAATPGSLVITLEMLAQSTRFLIKSGKICNFVR